MAKLGKRVMRLLGTTGVACMAVQPMVFPSVALGATDDRTEFHLNISLEANPSGDNDATVDDGTNDDAQQVYEDSIRAFAEAVYQATNGKHQIGSVTIYRNRAQWNTADVQWFNSCDTDGHGGPSTYPNGFGVEGVHIRMCTNWANSEASFNRVEGKGYTLAHEWGHYAYGLFDEYANSNTCEASVTGCDPYVAVSTDTEVTSIMSRERFAVFNSQDWLEFSTDAVEPYASVGDGGNKTAHARLYGESAWETLTRDAATDPKRGTDNWTFLPRTQYTALVAPSGSDKTINDNLSGVGDAVEIAWADAQVVELMMDASASMCLDPPDCVLLNKAKTVSKTLIDQLDTGVAVGVGLFAFAPTQEYAITEIPDPDTGVRDAAKAAIDAAGGTGGSDPYEAAVFALQQVQTYGGDGTASVFLISDGDDVDATTTSFDDVVNAYQDANVPLIVLGVGDELHNDTLRALAMETGGRFYSSTSDFADMQLAFLTAYSEFAPTAIVSTSTATLASSAVEVRSFVLDGGLGTAKVQVSYALDEADVTLRLLDENGADTGLTPSCEADTSVSCLFNANTLVSGAYGVEITNASTASKEVTVLVYGKHDRSADAVDIGVKFGDVDYPDNLSVTAVVSKGVPLTGLDVTATITRPDGTTFDVTLRDDGKNSDALADDGYYTADVPYDQEGSYQAMVTASNAAGNGQTTYEGRLYSAPRGDTAFVPTPQNVTDDFTRIAVKTASVSDFETDDHANNPAVPGDCSVQGSIFSDDNLDVLGRIEGAGDVDCFFLNINQADEDMTIRATSLSQNMKPVIRVYDPTGTTELYSVDMAGSESAALGVVGTVPAATLDFQGHVVTVEHETATATVGGYALSAGSPMFTDPGYVADVTDDNGGGDTGGGASGGALGPWSLLVAALLAFVGLRQRRTYG